MKWSRMILPLVAAGLGAAAGADYARWRSLGPGGVPHNVLGWLQVTYLRTKKRETTSADPYRGRLGELHDGRWVVALPAREGPRPAVPPYPIPQRQADQPGDLQARVRVREMFDDRAESGDGLAYAPSFFETRNLAITLTAVGADHQVARDARGEVAHIHPTDGSMHMILSPSDACTVLNAGWGERHPLAGVARGLPQTYLFVYAPRSLDEAATAGLLLDAAVQYMSQP